MGLGVWSLNRSSLLSMFSDSDLGHLYEVYHILPTI